MPLFHYFLNAYLKQYADKRLAENSHIACRLTLKTKMDYAGSMDFYEVTGAGAERQSGFFIIAEVIALPDMLDFRVQLKTETLMEFCSYRGFGLLLTDGWHISKGLLNGKVNRKL